MSSPTLQSALPVFLEWMPKIHEAHKGNAKFQQRLKAAESILQSIGAGLQVRDTLRTFAGDLKASRTSTDEALVRINEKDHSFVHLRLGALSGLVAATWGVYDNILFVCSLLLECDRSSSGSLPAFLDSKQVKIAPAILGGIRQRYGYPVAYSYQIRNFVMHRLPYLSDWQGGFASALISDGFTVTAASYQRHSEECTRNYKIRDGEAANYNFVSNSDQCLLEVLDRLQVHTDDCATEILQATLHPLNQSSLVSGAVV